MRSNSMTDITISTSNSGANLYQEINRARLNNIRISTMTDIIICIAAIVIIIFIAYFSYKNDFFMSK